VSASISLDRYDTDFNTHHLQLKKDNHPTSATISVLSEGPGSSQKIPNAQRPK
jgi:hypothetical protein